MSRLIDSAPPARPVAPRTDVPRPHRPVARQSRSADRKSPPALPPALRPALPARAPNRPGDPRRYRAATVGEPVPRRHREERRTVTVLFVDLVGFTALCDGRDPEDVRHLQTVFFEAVRGVVARWQGVVEKFIGDAVLAVFGALVAREHDAYRAVRAGLDIQRAMSAMRRPDGSPLRARVGVATGEAVVDLDAAAHDGGQALVSGDVVNTAARVQTHADPGSVAVTAATRLATAALVRYEPLPPIRVAGKSAPMTVWAARGHRPPRATAPSVAPLTGRPAEVAPLTGREAEAAVLAGYLAAALRGRATRPATVVGPPGIGKSRLVREVAARMGAAPDGPVQWWIGHCPPHADGPYDAFLGMLCAYAGVRDGDQPPTARRKLATALDALLGPTETPAALATISGARADGTAADAADAAHVWRRVLLAAAALSPLVLVVEDLHHSDATPARLLVDVVAEAAARELPLAAVITRRTALGDPGGTRQPATTDGAVGVAGPVLRLRPLTGPQVDHLWRHLTGGQPGGGAPATCPPVGGNPWYAVEYAHAAAKARPAVPEPLRRVLAAQLDRLDESARQVLLTAAVLGDVIRPAAVATLLDVEPRAVHVTVRRLCRAGALVRRADPAGGARPAWEFTDPVLRRVAYERLPRAVRADLHRRAARWLADTPGQRRGALHEERTRHWLSAYHLTRATGGDGRCGPVAAGNGVPAGPAEGDGPAGRPAASGAVPVPHRAARPGGWKGGGMGLFTVTEARAELARLRPVLDEVVTIRADAAELATALRDGVPTRLGGLPEWKAAQARLDELLTEIQQTGAELKGIAPLLIDFPADIDGESVLLCWLEGDEELTWYHRADLGFAGRRRLR